MACTIIKPSDRAEWSKLRKFGIGSSEVATVCGIPTYETKLQLYRRKLGIDPPQEENVAMLMGHLLEDAVAKRWEHETGIQVIKASQGDWLMLDNEKPFLRVSPDRTYWLPNMPHNNRNKGIVECKTTMLDIDADSIPQTWFLQLQYQLGVAGYSEGWLAWLKMGREFGCLRVTFDQDVYDWIVEEVTKFWNDHILARVEPEARTVSDMLLLKPRHIEGKFKEATSELLETCQKLKEVKENIASLTAAKEEYESAIKMFMEDAEALTINGKTLATWKAGKDKVDFDKKRFAAECPELFSQYSVSKPAPRTFLFKN